MRHQLLVTAAAASLLVAGGALAAEAPKVVASIQPLHSLVAGVMQGIAEPVVLVRGYGSPHTYQMRPSEAAALQEADVVFWIGEGLETFLVRPLAALGSHARQVALMDLDGLTLLETRAGGVWETDEHEHEHDAHGHGHDADADHDHDHGPHDAHLWLDVGNAGRMVQEIAAVLAELDPTRAAAYEANAAALEAELEALDEELRARLDPVRHVPFVVFHDAYQYLERRYGLSGAGAITVAPDRMPGARRLQEIRASIAERGARCVFREPQFESALVATVIEGTGAERGVLDPLGADQPPGPGAYGAMMRANAEALVGCLAEAS